jgi:hypothetical protein
LLESGIDCLTRCLDKKHFQNFPWPVSYQYNDRGYRDKPWPDIVNDLENSVWCFGDSFTVGIGSPRQHTWTYILSERIQKRTINVSMDGASNNWISRKIAELVSEIVPKHIVVHWSYIHRRENEWSSLNVEWEKFYNLIKDSTWPECNQLDDIFTLPIYIKKEILELHTVDERIKSFLERPIKYKKYLLDQERRIHHTQQLNDKDDIDNTINCINQIEQLSKKHGIRVLHSFIPNFANQNSANQITNYLDTNIINYIPEFKIIDWARDYHHYDIQTSNFFVDEICKKLSV